MSLLYSLLTALTLLACVSAQGLPTVQTPAAVVICQPVSLILAGGTAPYYLSVLPGGQISAPAIETIPGEQPAGAVTWSCDIQPGTSISFQIRDSTGQLNYSSLVRIQSGSDTSCIGKNSGNSATSGGPLSGSGSTSSGASVAGGASPSSSSNSTSGSSNSTSGSSSSSSSGSSSLSSSYSSSANPSPAAVGGSSSSTSTPSPNPTSSASTSSGTASPTSTSKTGTGIRDRATSKILAAVFAAFALFL